MWCSMVCSYDWIFYCCMFVYLYGIRTEMEACDNLWMFTAFLLFLNSGRLFLIHDTVISTCILYVTFLLDYHQNVDKWLIASFNFIWLCSGYDYEQQNKIREGSLCGGGWSYWKKPPIRWKEHYFQSKIPSILVMCSGLSILSSATQTCLLSMRNCMLTSK